MNDLELLRQYEPVVHYTNGEHFYPCAVDGYVQRCSLWSLNKKKQRQQLIPAGELDLDRLATFDDVPPGETLHLRIVDKPLDAVAYQRWRQLPDLPAFHAPGRFTRVGLVSRLASSLFNISLLVRGTVPGGTVAAADLKYREIRAADPRYVYYARVLRQGGYTILHYLFFFAMNDWRTSFFGINDHEADWEQCFIYLADSDEGLRPYWVAFASHDYSGDDLRRRWDDPDLALVDGRHPIIYAGAGSHASYFIKGEYLTGVSPSFLRPVANAVTWLQQFWYEELKQGEGDFDEEAVRDFFSVAFVDYARGDGLAVGPGTQNAWTPVLMDGQGWIENYRGLWGIDTEDPFGGERAPAGPKYNRDGSVRLAWYDPLAWAGLDKVPPPLQAVEILQQRIGVLSAERAQLGEEFVKRRQEVRNLGLDVQALLQTDYLGHLSKDRVQELTKEQKELQGMSARLVALDETNAANAQLLAKLQSDDWGDPQAHLKHQHLPETAKTSNSRAMDFWAAISGAGLLLALTVIIWRAPATWYIWTTLAILIFLAVESALRGRLSSYLLNVIIFLAVVTTLILLWQFWKIAIVTTIFALVILMVRDNLRELRGK